MVQERVFYSVYSTKNRAKAIGILGVISASSIIKCRLRLPQSSSKKRKRTDYSEIVSKGTATGHYLNFLKAIMDEMNIYEHMKEHY